MQAIEISENNRRTSKGYRPRDVRSDNYERAMELMDIGKAEIGAEEVPWGVSGLGFKANAMMECGEKIGVRVCKSCGEEREGSGDFSLVGKTCKARTCPYCSHVRGVNIAAKLELAFDEFGVRYGYYWQFLTQTFKYDKDREGEDLSWRGLRKRSLIAVRVATKQWHKLLRGDGTAMYRVVEISPLGAVHCHMIYFGPPVDKKKMEEIAVGVSPERGGYTLKKMIGRGYLDDGDENLAQPAALEMKRALRAVALYALKGMKAGNAHHPHMNEDWLIGSKFGDGIDPELAARWEAGTYNLRLSQSYGKLRGFMAAKDIDADLHAARESKDHDVACPCCGTVGDWETKVVSTYEWFRHCHFDKGVAALEGGRWTPPWLRKAKKIWRKKAVVRDY